MLAWNGTPWKAVGTLSWRLQGQQESTCQLSQTAETILGKGADGECLVSTDYVPGPVQAFNCIQANI